MSDIARQYALYYGDTAVEEFVKQLMEGDPATFKTGYTRENAIIAAAEAFGMERAEVEEKINV